jgi:hypothetical protein
MEHTNYMEPTVFNPMQLQLLRMFSYVKTDEQLKEIKAALTDYFFNKVGAGMDALEASGEWSKEKSDAIMEEHLHTPYVY